VLDQPDLSCNVHEHYFHQEGEDGIEQKILEQKCFICCLLFFSKAIMLDQSEMLFSVGDILTALTNVSGRKHPSTVQSKQLKMCLPMMSVVLRLVTSQVVCCYVFFFPPENCLTKDKLLRFPKM